MARQADERPPVQDHKGAGENARVSPGEVKSFVRVRTNFGVGSPGLAAQQHAIRARCSIARFDVAFPHESEVMN